MIGESLSHFRITAKLGAGGMGEVYRADDTKLGREVALKVLPPAFAGDPERMGRFAREAQVLASLNHPNIAAIYGLEEAAGRRALVMELVEGETLAERIGRGTMPLEEALKISLQVAQALEAAHEKGIVHRDLKPANVKITPEGQVKVLDFGLAKALEEQRPQGDMANSPTLTAAATQMGIILGTAAYMSPEQAAGQLADRRADIWSFGVVLFEMLTGKRQFAGETVSHTLAAVLQKEPDWGQLPEDLPAPIGDLLARCLRKKPRQRLQAIGDARVAIEDYLADPDAFAAGAEPQLAAAAAVPAWKRLLPWGVAGLALAAFAASLLIRPSPQTPSRQIRRLEVAVSREPLWVSLGEGAMLSPDGNRLAFVVGEGDVQQLYLRSLDQLEATRVTQGSGGSVPYHPFFSPDGQWVGFVTPGELKKVPVTGGTAMTLCEVDRSRGATWIEDGTIVFAPNPSSGLMRVPAAGGEPEVLTTLDEAAGETSHRWPYALPGGGAVLFTSQTAQSSNFNGASIEAVILETKERKLIHRGGYFGRYSPSGHLLYVNDGTLFAIPLDIERLETSGSAAPVVPGVATNVSDGGAQISIAPNGTLAYVSGDLSSPQYQVLRVSRDGASTVLWHESGAYATPRLSPDGRRLALTLVREDNPDIWIYDLERAVGTRLTFEDGYESEPVWSPDGDWVAYAAESGGTIDVFRKRADGSGETQRVTQNKATTYPSTWSADGRLIAGMQLGEAFDLWVMPLNGEGELELFLATGFSEEEPSFSPDGRWIAYQADETGRYEVYVRPYPASGGKWQVSDGGGARPHWSSSGRELYFRSDGGIMVVDVETGGATFRAGRPRPLFEGAFRGGIAGMGIGAQTFWDYDVSPDASYFVMFPQITEEGRGGHVTLVLNWTDDLNRILPSRPAR